MCDGGLHPKIYLNPSGILRCRVSFIIGTDFEKFSITSVAHHDQQKCMGAVRMTVQIADKNIAIICVSKK